VSAYKAQTVIQEWQVQTDDDIIKGRDEEGKVALKFDSDALHVYFATNTAETKAAQWQLVDRLYDFCGMGKVQENSQQHKFLLIQILQADSQEEVDDLLDRAAVPPLASDEAVDEAAERLRKEQARQRTMARAGEDSPWNSRRSNFQKLFAAGGVYIIGGSGGNLFGNGSASSFGARSNTPSPNARRGLRQALEGTTIYGNHGGYDQSARTRGEKAQAAMLSRRAEELVCLHIVSRSKANEIVQHILDISADRRVGI
jgi:hypothetical protein